MKKPPRKKAKVFELNADNPSAFFLFAKQSKSARNTSYRQSEKQLANTFPHVRVSVLPKSTARFSLSINFNLNVV
jgi:hypothetical protein